MAVVGLTEIKGNTEELLAKYDKANAAIMRDRPAAPGLLSHTCVVLPDGIRIANVFESEEQCRASFRNPQFQEILRNAGFDPIEPTVYKAHNFLVFSEARVS
jgi:hypothetical protein